MAEVLRSKRPRWELEVDCLSVCMPVSTAVSMAVGNTGMSSDPGLTASQDVPPDTKLLLMSSNTEEESWTVPCFSGRTVVVILLSDVLSVVTAGTQPLRELDAMFNVKLKPMPPRRSLRSS